ncbi:hypothetical protein [Polyangium sp. y55x31]|uniref:hypothetical protein n=1 Tax=Polyangium sp. y55x31 TaxID=3042688 RepID=UPI00248277DB|nr:hypothetical protein [Polyangium sp. y55x31]MDI1477317.1 hypothetical protein [Polyangium sp. y55x31]
MSPVGGPTHSPLLLMTSVPLIVTLVGWMSPFTSFASSAYGTLWMGARGWSSGSLSIVIPRYRTEPSNTLSPNGTSEPSETE